jgi:vacuolar-type H+-ATPase subunit H
MSKIEEAIKDAHEAADKAIDEVQEEIQETRMEVRAWLKEECTFKRSEIIVVGVCVIASLWILGIT